MQIGQKINKFFINAAKNKPLKVIQKVSNMIVLASFIISAMFMMQHDLIIGVLILLAMGMYMLFIKMDNLERSLRGI